MVRALGGYCRAFDQPRRVPRPDDKDAERFLRYFRQLVKSLRQNPNADPKSLERECPRDTTLYLEPEGVQDQLNVVGFVHIMNPLLEIPAILSRAPILLRNAPH